MLILGTISLLIKAILYINHIIAYSLSTSSPLWPIVVEPLEFRKGMIGYLYRENIFTINEITTS